jgi:regulator of replication initiation timing
MAKNKETTIDELAMMVQKGFQGMDEKIEGMDKKMDEGFKQVNERIDGMQKEMNVAVKEIDNLQRGQERIEDRLDEIVPGVKEQKEILKEHDKRITVLETKALLAK